MKELSTEEKAKAYDEVLNKLRRFIAEGVNPLITRADVQDFFPELAESEDERIRKRIIHALHGDVLDIEETNKAIAWLEKQGEQKPADTDNKFLRMRETKPANIVEFLDRLTTVEQEFLWELIEKVKKIDREEREQKPITPKFKINDVIKYNQKQWTIIGIDINNHCYDLDNDECVDFDTADYNFELVEQKTTEWSEEDERLRTSCIKHIEEELERIRNDKYGHSEIISDLKESCRERINWLKSLRPQNTWRPSDEQMITLRHVISGCSYDIEPLVELETKLKEL